MSAIKYGIDRIFREINPEILTLAFMRKSDFFSIKTTLAAQIEDLVIKNIVLKDTNLIGGITVRLPLNNCRLNYYEQNMTGHNLVIFVPYNLTNNKKIIEPTLLMSTTDYGSKYNITKNVVMNDLNKIMDKHSISNNFTTSNLELVAPNTILVHDSVYMISSGFLEVIVENNNNLSNISPRTYFLFGEMCVLAAKMFIYNKLIVDLDSGVLYGGHELSKAKDIIDSYESAFEDYKTFIEEKWSKALFMNDSIAMNDFIKGMIGNHI